MQNQRAMGNEIWKRYGYFNSIGCCSHMFFFFNIPWPWKPHALFLTCMSPPPPCTLPDLCGTYYTTLWLPYTLLDLCHPSGTLPDSYSTSCANVGILLALCYLPMYIPQPTQFLICPTTTPWLLLHLAAGLGLATSRWLPHWFLSASFPQAK